MEKKRFFVTVALIILLAMFASQFSKWEGNSYTGHSIWDQNIEDLVEFKEIKNLNVRKEGLFTNIGVDTGLFVVVDNGKKELLLKSGFNLNSYSMRDNFEGKEGSVIWIEYVPKGRLYYEELDYDGVLISYNSDMEPRKIIIQDLIKED